MRGTRFVNIDANILKNKDLKRIRNVFPDIEILAIEASNLLVTKYDLREFRELRKLELTMIPDNDYPGLFTEKEIKY